MAQVRGSENSLHLKPINCSTCWACIGYVLTFNLNVIYFNVPMAMLHCIYYTGILNFYILGIIPHMTQPHNTFPWVQLFRTLPTCSRWMKTCFEYICLIGIYKKSKFYDIHVYSYSSNYFFGYFYFYLSYYYYKVTILLLEYSFSLLYPIVVVESFSV